MRAKVLFFYVSEGSAAETRLRKAVWIPLAMGIWAITTIYGK
jgi:hypothetical protein